MQTKQTKSVLAGVAGRGFRLGADRPVEDVCD
jgi:hypothetical protein